MKLKRDMERILTTIDEKKVCAQALDSSDQNGTQIIRLCSLEKSSSLNYIPIAHLLLICREDQMEAKIVDYKGFVKESHDIELAGIEQFIKENSARLLRFKHCQGLPSTTVFKTSSKIIEEVFPNDEVIYRSANCQTIFEKSDNSICGQCKNVIVTKREDALEDVENSGETQETVITQESYICPACDKEFNCDMSMKQHFRRNHGKKKHEWICKVVNCGRTFTREDNLKVHMKNHNNLNKYQCQHCAALFSRNGNLTEHIRRNHSLCNEGNKNWSCADCSKQFHTRQQLERHRRIHLGEKPHKCDYCEKSFTRSHHLSRHIKSTHNDRLYEIKFNMTDQDGNIHTVVQTFPPKKNKS